MKIETCVKTLREVTCEATYDEGNNTTSYVTAYVGEDAIREGAHLNVTAPSYMTRARWDDFKKLGDAAWEAWDKTFGDKQPETLGVWRPMFESAGHGDGRFVWFPGDHDFKGSAQHALDALKAERPEWRLGLREYKVYKCATCQGCGGHLCEKPDHERCKGQTAACTRKTSSK